MPDLTFCRTASELKTAVHNGLRASQRALQAFLDLPKDSEPAEVLLAFDQIQGPLNGWAQQAHIFQQVHPDEDMQRMGARLEQEVHAFRSELALHREVFDRLSAIQLPQDAPFEERRFLERSLRNYRRSGVDRSESTRERVRQLQEELLEVGQDFDRNIVAASTSIDLAGGHRALQGMPADFLASHPENPDGTVTLSTDPPEFIPTRLYCEVEETRRLVSQMYYSRAHPENEAPLLALLEKRRELAQLLGFDTWADYITADKMIGSGQAVAEFIERVIGRAKEPAQREMQELLAAKQTEDPSATELHAYDVLYWIERIQRDRLGFDSQDLRPYLGFENVQRGVLETAEKLFGIRFEQRPDVATWHPDAHAYDVLDGEERVGRFYLDMGPRPGKFKHAAVMDIRSGIAAGHGRTEELPEAALVCNFTQPTASDPGLMLHSQVTTFFHEFGHLMHHMLSGQQRFYGFGGFGVEWDFVEVPSQLFEEWAWDPAVLATFATHVETGEPIPAALVEGLRRAQEYGKALGVLRQMFLATLSLELHTRDPKNLNVGALAQELRPRLTLVKEQPDTFFHCSFGHLNGYSAMYYTYMWSLVIAKDLWSQFEADPMNRAVATAYRQKVLAKGGGLDAADQVQDFLGRGYRFDAWENWLRS